MKTRTAFGTIAASLLTMAMAAPAAGAAVVERTSASHVNDCEVHHDEDPVTGEPFFTEFCTDGVLEFNSVVTPSGVSIQSGRVATTLRIRHNGEILLSEESQTNRFRSVSRNGFEQVSRLSFTSSFVDHVTSGSRDCVVTFHVANGELRSGSFEMVCEGDGGGGGGEG